MAGFGRRTRVSRTVDLTCGDQSDGRKPGPRAHASDVATTLNESVLSRLLQVALKIEDKAGSEAAKYLWCTCTAMIPPLVTLVICLAAGVRGSGVVIPCLSVLAISGALAVAVYYGARRARRQHMADVEQDRKKRTPEQQPIDNAKLKNKRKTVRGTRRGRKGGGTGGRSPRGRRA